MHLRLFAVFLLLTACAHSRVRQDAAQPGKTRQHLVDFSRDVRPILEARCQPCHFQGGRVYDRLPLDRAEATRQLGPKLLSRIKAEDEQAVIRQFLSQDQ
jgi:hypothetical protein